MTIRTLIAVAPLAMALTLYAPRDLGGLILMLAAVWYRVMAEPVDPW